VRHYKQRHRIIVDRYGIAQLCQQQNELSEHRSAKLCGGEAATLRIADRASAVPKAEQSFVERDNQRES
jgi:hypothetical protein